MYARKLSNIINKFKTIYPVIGITGPRQSGKTTLAKTLFTDLPYISLENLDIRLRAEQDPRSFLEMYSNGAIFDEIQHVPQLLSYLQEIVDNNQQKGRYVITGSQNFTLNACITQSLPGRIGMVTLLPLSLAELQNDIIDPYHAIFTGGYPGLHKLNINPLDFYPSYIQTYVERDVKQLKNIENLSKFQNFLKLCIGRIGQVVNFASLAQDTGISHTTARQWLTILEASYIIFTLQPYYNNFNKRLTKMPKIYAYDTGLACNLLGLEQQQQLNNHYLKGSLFENLIVLEILKKRLNFGLPHNLYFWRDHPGHEIDIIGDWGNTIHAMEIKLNATLQSSHIKNLKYFANLNNKTKKININNYLIYTGTQEGKYLGVELIPYQQINNKMLN